MLAFCQLKLPPELILVSNWLIAFTFKDVDTEPTVTFCGAKFWAYVIEALKINELRSSL